MTVSQNAQLMFTGVSVAVEKGYLTEENFPYEITTLNDGKYYLSWEIKDTFLGRCYSIYHKD